MAAPRNHHLQSHLPDPQETARAFVERAEVRAQSLEFSSFLLGIKRRQRTGEQVPADELTAWRKDVKRLAGLELAGRWGALGRTVDFEHPDVVFQFDVDEARLKLELRPVYVYGRYRKLGRDLPQTMTHWRCHECAGQGCPACGDSGRRYPVSLGELIARPLEAAFRARRSSFHGLGREDVDVLCLGSGRPFVVELINPDLRSSVDLEALREQVDAACGGRVEMGAPLRLVRGDDVARVKNWEADKTYRALCATPAAPDPTRLAALPEALSGATLAQQTPQRVSHRRADLVRRRTLRSVELEAPGPDASPTSFVLRIKAQSGTYIKELISGDEDRTQPSVSELLGLPAVCARLDVLEIEVGDDELLGVDASGDSA